MASHKWIGGLLAAVGLLLAAPCAQAAVVKWAGPTGGTDFTWETVTNWNSGAAPTAADDLTFDANAGTITIAPAGGTANSLNFAIDGFTIAGGTLTLANTAPPGGNTVTVAAGKTGTITSTLNTAGLTLGGGGTLVFGGTGVNNLGGAVVVDASTLSISDANHIQGATDIQLKGGTLAVTNDVVNSAATLTMGTGGGTLNIATGKTFTQSATLGASSASLTKTGGGTLVLQSDNSVFSGAVNINGGIVSVGAANSLGDGSATNTVTLSNGRLTLTGSMDLGATRTLNVGTGSSTLDIGANAVTISGPVTGGAANTLTKVGSGTLTFAGSVSNTFTGKTILSEGVLLLQNSAGNAIAGDIDITPTLTHPVLRLGAANQIADTSVLTLRGFAGIGSGHFDMNGFNETIGGIVIINNQGTGSSTIATAGATLTLLGNVNISGSSPATGAPPAGTSTTLLTGNAIGNLGGTLDLGGGVRTFDISAVGNAIVNANVINGGITKIGATNLQLRGTNTFAGGLTVNGGLVDFNADNQLGGAGNVITLNGGGIAYTSTTADLTLARVLNIGASGGTIAGSRKIIQSTADQLKGAAGTVITKAGTNALVLNAANPNFGGTWNITGGQVEVQNAAGLGTLANNVTVAGGELAINSTIPTWSQSIVANGGTISGTGGNVTFTNNISVGGNFAFGLRDYGTAANGRTVTLSGNLVSTAAGNVTLTGPSGGSGTLVLTGDNTGFTGGYTINTNAILSGQGPKSIRAGSNITLNGGQFKPAIYTATPTVGGTQGFKATYINNYDTNLNTTNIFAVDRLYLLSHLASSRTEPNANQITTNPTNYYPPNYPAGMNTTGQNVAVLWQGVLDITTGGTYTFSEFADDRATLFIDGTQVINITAASLTPVTGNVNLSAGAHSIAVRFANSGTIGYHSLSYQGADTGGTLAGVGTGAVAAKLTNGSLPTLAMGDLTIAGGTGTVDLIQPQTYTNLNYTASGTLAATSTTIDTLTVTGNTVLSTGANPTFAPNTAKILLQGPIMPAAGNTGANNITASGTYLMEIQGNNTYSGSFTVTNGEVDLNSAGTAITGNLVLNSANSLGGGRISNVKLLQNNQIADASIVTVQNFSVLDLNGKNETISNLKMQAQGLVMGAGTLTVSDLGGGNSLFESGTILSNLAGSGGLNKTLATGTLVLAGNNTYTGITSVGSGMLRVVGGTLGATGAGNETIVANGATLQLLGGANNSAEAVTAEGTGVAPYGVATGAIWNAGGANSLGAVTLSGDTSLQICGGTLTVPSLTNTGSWNVTVQGAGELVVGSVPALSGGTLTKLGRGTLTFNVPGLTSIPAVTHTGGTIGFMGLQNLGAVAVPAGLAYKFYGDPGAGVTSITVPAGSALINGGVASNGLLGRVTSGTGAFIITQDSSANLDFTGKTVGLGAQGLVNYTGAITPGSGGYAFTGLPAELGEPIAPNRLTLTQALSGSNIVTVSGGGLDLTRLTNTQSGTVSITDGAVVEMLNNQNLGDAANGVTISGGATLRVINNGTNLAGNLFTMLGNPVSSARRVVTIGAGGGTIDVPALSSSYNGAVLGGDFSSNLASNPLQLDSGAPSTAKLTKAGLGMLFLTNASDFAGTIEIGPNGNVLDLRNNGALTNANGIIINTGSFLDVRSDSSLGQNRQIPQVNLGDRVANFIPITVQGGRLLFDAKNQAFNLVGNAETFGTVTLANGQSEIRAERSGGGGSDLILTNLTRQTGGVVRFTGENTLAAAGDNTRIILNQINSTAPADNQFIGGWALVNSTDFAVYKTQASAGAAGGVVAYGATVTGLTIPAYTALTSTTSAGGGGFTSGSIGSAAADVALGTPGGSQDFVVGALRLAGAATRNLTFANTSNVDRVFIESGAILSDGSNNARNIGANTSNFARGMLIAGSTSASTPQELFLHNNSNTTTIFSAIVDNPNNSSATVSVVKDLDGTVLLTPVVVRAVTTAIGSTTATVTGAGGTADLVVGQPVTGGGIPVGATIVGITDATHFELSSAATTAGTAANLTFHYPNTYTGGTYVNRGTLEAQGIGSLGSGPVTVKNSRLNINFAGTINASSPTGGFTMVDQGEIFLNNTTASFTTMWDRFVVPAGSTIIGPNGSNANQGLNSLTRVSAAPSNGGEIQLAPGAIIGHQNVPANGEVGIGTNTIKNLGQASDLWFGLSTNFNSPLATLTVGTGTPWKGISTDRTNRNWQQGTILANGDFWLQGLTRDNALAALQLGAPNATGTYAIVNQAGRPINAYVGGSVILGEDTAPVLPSNLTFVVTSGSILTANYAWSLGSNTDITQNAKIRILAGGTLDPGPYVPVGSLGFQPQGVAYPVGNTPLNGLVTVEAGGRMLLNDTSGIGSTTAGAWTIKTDGILEIGNGNVALGSTGGTINPNQFVFEPASIVRIRDDIRVYRLDLINGSTGGATAMYEMANSDKNVTEGIDPRVVTGIGNTQWTRNVVTLAGGGGLTNDANDRTVRNRRGIINLGDGAVLAATTQTLLSIQQHMVLQPGANITIGASRYIDGMPKLGQVRLTGTAGNIGDASNTVTVIDGAQLSFNAAWCFPDATNLSLPAPVTAFPSTGSTLPMTGNGSSLVLDSGTTEFIGKLTGNGMVFSNQDNSALAVGYGATSDFTFDGVIKAPYAGTDNKNDPMFAKVGTTKLTLTNSSDSQGHLYIYQGEVSLAGPNGRWGSSSTNISQEMRLAKSGILTFDNTVNVVTDRFVQGTGGNDWLNTAGGGEFRVLGNATTAGDVLMFGLADGAGTGIHGYAGGNSGGFGKVTVVPSGDLSTLRTSVTFNQVENFQNSGERTSAWLIRGVGVGGLPGTFDTAGNYTPNPANPKDGLVFINNPRFNALGGNYDQNAGAAAIVGAPGTPIVPVRGDLLASASPTATEGDFATIDVTTGAGRTGVRPLAASEYATNAMAVAANATVGLNVRASGAVNFTAGDTRFQVIKFDNGSSLNVTGVLPNLTQPAQVMLNAGGILVPSGASASITAGAGNVVRTNGGVAAYIHAFGNLNVDGEFFSDIALTKTGPGTVNFTAGSINNLRGRLVIHDGTVSINDSLITVRNTATGASAFDGVSLELNGGTLNINGKSQQFNRFESGNILAGATTGGGTLTSATAATVTFQSGGTFSGNITGPISLDKVGNNTWTLTSPVAMTGSLAVRQGTLNLRDAGSMTGVSSIDLNYGRLDIDNGGQPAASYIDRVKTGVNLAMRGGDVVNRGRAGTLTQEHFGTVSLLQGNNLFQTLAGGGGATETRMANLVRSPGATVQFNQNYGFIGTSGNDTTAIRYLPAQINGAAPALVNNILPAWININGDHFATWNATTGLSYLSNTEDGYATYDSTDVTTATATQNVNDGANRTISASKTVNAIRNAPNAANAFTIAAGQTLTIASGGLLVNNNNVFTYTGGAITSGSGELNVFVNQNRTDIISQITGGISLTKAGGGTLRLQGNNTYTGATYLAGAGASGGPSALVELNTPAADGNATVAIPGDVYVYHTTLTELLPNEIKSTATVNMFGGTVVNLRDAENVTETLKALTFANASGDNNARAIITRANGRASAFLNLTAPIAISAFNDNPTSTPALSQNLGWVNFTSAGAQEVKADSPVSLAGLSAAGLILNASVGTVPTGVAEGGLKKTGTGMLVIGGQLVYSGTTAASSVDVTVGSTTGLAIGMPVSGTGIAAGSSIASITDATHYKLSIAATAAGTNTLTYVPINGFGNPAAATDVFNITSGFVRADTQGALGGPNAVTTVQGGATLLLNNGAGVLGSIRLKDGSTFGLSLNSSNVGAEWAMSSGTTSGSSTVTVPSTANLRAGMLAGGAGIPIGARILAINDATTITLDQNATASATAALSYSSAGTLEVPAGATTNVQLRDYFVPNTNAGNLVVYHKLTGGGTINLTGIDYAAGYNGGGVFQLRNTLNDFSGLINIGTNAVLESNPGPATGAAGSALGTAAINLNGGVLRIRDQGDTTATAQTLNYNNNVTLSDNSMIDLDRTGTTASNKTIALGTLTVTPGTRILSTPYGTNDPINPNGMRLSFSQVAGAGTLVKGGSRAIDLNGYDTSLNPFSGNVEISGPQGMSLPMSGNLTFNNPTANNLNNLTVKGFQEMIAGRTVNVANVLEVGNNAGQVTNGLGFNGTSYVPVSSGEVTGALLINTGAVSTTTNVLRNKGIVGPSGGAAAITATTITGSGVYAPINNDLTVTGTLADDGATATTLKVAGNNTLSFIPTADGLNTGGAQVQRGVLRVAPTANITNPLGTGPISVYAWPTQNLARNTATVGGSQPVAAASAELRFDAGVNTVTQNSSISNNGLVRVASGNVNVAGSIGGFVPADFTDISQFKAATVPGLLEGTVSSGTIDNSVTRAGNTGQFGIKLEPRMGQTNVVTNNSVTGWTGNQNWVYTGYFYDADGVFTFAEQVDDFAMISIDGVTRLQNTTGTSPWSTITSTASSKGQRGTAVDAGVNTPNFALSSTTVNGNATITVPGGTSHLAAGMAVSGTGIPANATIASITDATHIVLSSAATADGTANLTYTNPIQGLVAIPNNPSLPAGWHTIEIRMANGGGGAGPVPGNGFTNNYGIGFNPNGTMALDGTQFNRPIDNGSGNLFRTAVYGKGNVQVDAGAALSAYQLTNTGKLTLGVGASATLNPPSVQPSAVDQLEALGNATLTTTANASLTAGNVSVANGSTMTHAGAANRLVITGNATGGTINSTGVGGVTFNSNAAQSASSAIAGNGGLVKDGSGTLTLSGKNTYAGPTTINAGVIRLTDGAPTAGAAVWYDAADVTGTGTNPASGSSLSTWVNKGSGGSTFDAVASGVGGAQTPTIAGAALNGMDLVNFVRTDDFNMQFLEVNNAAVSTLLNGPHTVLVVARATAGNTGTLNNTDSSVITFQGFHSGFRFGGTTTATNMRFNDWGAAPDGEVGTTVAYTQGVFSIGEGVVDGSPAAGPLKVLLVKDGITSPLVTDPRAMKPHNNLMRLGAGNDPGANWSWGLTGDIAEVLIYNSALSAADLQASGNYLAAKWFGSITDNIPDASPVTFGAGAGLDINGHTETIGSLNSTQATSSVLLGTGTLRTGFDNTNASFAGGISGTGGGLTKIGTGIQTIAGGTYTGPTNVNSGTLVTTKSLTSVVNVANGATFEASSSGTGLAPARIDVAGLTLGADVADAAKAKITAAATGGTVLVTPTLAMTGSGSQIDVNSNGLVLNYDGSIAGEKDLRNGQIRQWIKEGRNTGNWDGPTGITSKLITPVTAADLAVGYKDSSAISPTGGTFMGQAVDGSAVLVRYTMLGDSNLDGVVNFIDLVAVAQNYNTAGTGTWQIGDFNYDGDVNFIDLVAVAQHYNQGLALTASIPGASAQFQADWNNALAIVPEPGTFSLLALGSLLLMRRGSRRRAA